MCLLICWKKNNGVACGQPPLRFPRQCIYVRQEAHWLVFVIGVEIRPVTPRTCYSLVVIWDSH